MVLYIYVWITLTVKTVVDSRVLTRTILTEVQPTIQLERPNWIQETTIYGNS